MAGLLEQAAALRLGLAQLLRGVAVRVREQLPRLVAGVVQHLRALAFALLAETLDVGLSVLLLAAAAADLLLGLPEWSLRRALRVGLDRVGARRCGPNPR